MAEWYGDYVRVTDSNPDNIKHAYDWIHSRYSLEKFKLEQKGLRALGEPQFYNKPSHPDPLVTEVGWAQLFASEFEVWLDEFKSKAQKMVKQ